MKITVLTLFENTIWPYLNSSIMLQAQKANLVQFEVVNWRNFCNDKHKTVDDMAYGGGGGMVLKAEPIINCLNFYKAPNSHVVLLSPEGEQFSQNCAKKLTKYEHLILLSGHYEGFDQRIYKYIDQIVSLGDFVLSGGELVALSVIDATVRLIKGVINDQSLICESFNDNLLDFPVYTRPYDLKGDKVPEVLLSGDHQKIESFRKEQQILKTAKYRPDLYKKYLENKNEKNK